VAEVKISPKLKQKVLFLFVLAAVRGGPAVASPQELLRLTKSADAMGSTFTVELYGYDRVQMDENADEALNEVRRLDEMLSNYIPESEWSQVNRQAATRPVQVSPELFKLLSECLEYSRQSEGAFDITVGPLMRVWGFFMGTGHLPQHSQVTAALAKIGYRHIHLDPQARTVRFDRPGVEMDPGGIGKGYAVDRMVDVLRSLGVTTALVAGSGSSIYGLGAPPEQPEGWPVKITDPKDTRKTVAQVFLKDMSMSTSGSYEKFFRADGRIYAHIMDPRTGYPAQGTLAVSVLAPHTLDSEAWAKPYFVNGRQWAAQHKPKDFRVFFCEDRTDKPCVWLQ
jgi:thiamine biosynthesis lipoprotein